MPSNTPAKEATSISPSPCGTSNLLKTPWSFAKSLPSRIRNLNCLTGSEVSPATKAITAAGSGWSAHQKEWITRYHVSERHLESIPGAYLGLSRLGGPLTVLARQIK